LSLARGKENTVKATKRELEQMLHLCPWAKAEYIQTAEYISKVIYLSHYHYVVIITLEDKKS